MAQIRIHDWKASATAASWNQKWYEAFGNFVLNDLAVAPGSSGMKVTIRAGAGIIGGVEFVEGADLVDAVTVSNAPAVHPRIDIIAAQYTYQASSPKPTVSYLAVTGSEAAEPTAPSLGTNQVELASVLLGVGDITVDVDAITNAAKLRDRLQALVPNAALTLRDQPFYVEGTVWARDTDPLGDATITVVKGDLWVDTSEGTPSFYKYNGTTWQDVQDWDQIKNKPSSFNPEEHALAGAIHTGDLSLDRITGHTAFGPAAHQQAFAASVLRRPA